MSLHSFGARTLLALSAAVVLSACSTVRPPSGPAPSGPDAGAPYPAYETFDDAEYPAQSPGPVEIVHDVPARVMDGRVVVPASPAPPAPVAPQPRQVEGYRVQIFSSASQESAERIRTSALAWWETAQRSSSSPAEMAVVVTYLQPYYRVRMGGFATREEADQALAFVRQQYPEAFLVPDLVTVTR